MISTCGRQHWLSASSLSKPFRILLSPFTEWKDLCFVVRYKFPIAALFTAGLTSLAVLHLYSILHTTKRRARTKPDNYSQKELIAVGQGGQNRVTLILHGSHIDTQAGKRLIQPIRSLWEETGRGIPNKETGKLILAETRAFTSKNCGHCFGTQSDAIQKHLEVQAKWGLERATKTAVAAF